MNSTPPSPTTPEEVEAFLASLPDERPIKIKLIPPERANAPYSDAEVELILRLTPTRDNVALLARTLKRTRAAISMIYAIAYSGTWLKQTLEANNGCTGRSNVHLRIAEVKDRLGIIIGHQPKARSLTIGKPAGY